MRIAAKTVEVKIDKSIQQTDGMKTELVNEVRSAAALAKGKKEAEDELNGKPPSDAV